MKVLIAHSEISNKTKWKKFMSVMSDMLCSLEGYDIRPQDITFGTTRSRIDVNSVKEYGLVIAREVVDGVSIGPGTVKKYYNANPELKFILVVDKEKKSAGKLNALYNLGYFDALLSNDFTKDSVEKLILNGRTQKEAYEYYGLMLYSDYSKVRKEGNNPVEEEPISKVTKRGADDNGDAENTGKTVDSPAKAPDLKAGDSQKQKGAKQSQKDGKNKGNKNATKIPADSKGEQKGNEEGAGVPSVNESVEESGKESLAKPKKSKKKDTAVEMADVNDDIAQPAASDMDKTVQNTSYEDTSTDNVRPLVDTSLYQVRENDMGEVDEQAYEDYPYEEEVEPTQEELLTEEENHTFDASDFLVPVMVQNHVEAPDLEQEVSEADIKRYIKAIEKKAFNPISVEVDMSREDRILEEILVYYTEQDTHWLADLESGILTRDHFAQHLWQRIQTLYGDLSDEDQTYIYQRFSSFMWGYDVITPLIEDPTISDIALVAYDNIQVKRYGERYFSKLTFRTPNHFKNFINHIIRFNHVDLSDKKPDKTFMDTSTSALARMRFVYSQGYINANGAPSLIIRKVPTKKYTLDELVGYDMMDYRTAAIILEEVRKGHSIIWTGTMASGKTSQMNTYLDFIRHDQRGLVMQENEELFSNTHPLMQFQNIRPSEDGETLYDLRYLATFGLLMDLNYFMIGEIKGAEAEQFVEAVYTNTTCWGSVHSISARDALPRIATLAVTKHFSEEEQLRKLSGGIDMVVYLNKFVVEEIVRVKGWDEKNKCTIYESVEINIPKKQKGSKGKRKTRKG